MNKLIEAYRTNATLANARKLKVYSRKHPFASCLMTQEDSALLMVALRHAMNIAQEGVA